MPRLIVRALVALSASIVLGVLGMLWWLPTIGSSQPARPSAGANEARYCSNWDFLNNTGQELNDLHVTLKGIKNVTDVYTGTLNAFGAPDGTSGYDAGADVYHLNFSGATIYSSDRVQIGLCTDQASLRLDSSGQPAFVWTSNGASVSPNPLFTGLEWNWQGFNHLRVHIVNEQPMTVTLMTLNLLDAGIALGLDDLNGMVSAQLPLALELLPTPQTLPPLGDSFFDVFFDPGSQATPPDHAPLLEPNHPYVLEAELHDANDDGNSAHLYAQGLTPLTSLYLPIILK